MTIFEILKKKLKTVIFLKIIGEKNRVQTLYAPKWISAHTRQRVEGKLKILTANVSEWWANEYFVGFLSCFFFLSQNLENKYVLLL